MLFLLNDEDVDLTELKAFEENKSDVVQLLWFVKRVENTVEKTRKCWLPTFSPIPITF